MFVGESGVGKSIMVMLFIYLLLMLLIKIMVGEICFFGCDM